MVSEAYGTFCRRGRAVVKETAKVRELRDIWSDQPALWKIKVAIVTMSLGGKTKSQKFCVGSRECFDLAECGDPRPARDCEQLSTMEGP